MSDYIPQILVCVTILLVGGSTIYAATQVGTSDTRNELQKSISVLAIANIVGSLVLGFLLYYYMTKNSSFQLPIVAVMFTFSAFLSIMSLSVSLIQKVT